MEIPWESLHHIFPQLNVYLSDVDGAHGDVKWSPSLASVWLCGYRKDEFLLTLPPII